MADVPWIFAWVPPLVRRGARVFSDTVGHLRVARLIVATIRLLWRSQFGPRSAEIAYYSILSTIPFGALLLTALAYGAVDLLDSGWTREELSATIRDLITSFVPAAGAELDAAIHWLLDRRGALGALGSVTLLFTSSLVFGAISRATSAIFAKRSRDRFTTTILFALALCGVAVLLLAGLPRLSAIVSADAGAFDARAESNPIAFRIASDTLMVLCFLFLLVAVVRVRVRIHYAIAGAGLYILLFELARWGFTAYLTHLGRLNLVYGSLAGVMAAIVWAYYVAATLLVSLCVVRVLQDRLWDSPYGEVLPAEPVP